MSRHGAERLDGITAAIEAIQSHVGRGPLSDSLVSDAVRIRLVEIGETVKTLSEKLTSTEADIPWRQIARMRDHLAHRYFMTELEIIQSTIEEDLGPLQDAFDRMRARSTSDPGDDSTHSESAD